jgi:uncharacterized membrane protein
MAMRFEASQALADSFDSLSLGDLMRWSSIGTAAALVAYGMTRRSTAGICVMATAIPFAYRGLTGRWPPGIPTLGHAGGRNSLSALAGEGGIHVRESIRLEKPLDDVYRFWRRLENLPRFMTHLDDVTTLDDRRSHWVACGPGGLRVEWDAEIINEVENQVIGWRSLPDSDVVTAGSVNFDSARAGRGTQVTVHLQYAAMGGRVGAALAMLFGREPSQMIREDLRRLKQILEAGEVATAKPRPETDADADTVNQARPARLRLAPEARP